MDAENIDNDNNTDKTNSTDDNYSAANLIEFSKIIKDLLRDLCVTFSDKLDTIIENNNDFKIIINYDLANLETDNVGDLSDNPSISNNNKNFLESVKNIFNHCKSIFPHRFFDILYQNEDIFNNETNTEFLPNITFSTLYFDTTSSATKETLWKYLQLILFTIVTTIDNKESFGNNEKLFEAINGDEFKNKLQETVKEMENLFNFKNNDDTEKPEKTDISNANSFNFNKLFEGMNIDSSNINFNNLPDSNTIHDHINNLINGKLGSLAKELAEETTKDLDLDVENITDVNDLFKQLFKNPNKLMSLVSSISSKLDTKMKDGSIKESELLEEASSIFKNMQSVPGMGNFESLFKSMNLDQLMPKGGKFNNNAFQHMMDQNIKMSKTRERMKKKAEKNKNTSQTQTQTQNQTQQQQQAQTQQQQAAPNLNSSNLNDINSNLMSLMEQMQQMQNSSSFIDDILKKQNLGSNDETKNPLKPKKKKKGNRKK